MKKSNTGFYAALTLLIAVGCFLYSWKILIPKSIQTKKEINTVEAETKSASAKLESLKVAKSSLDQMKTVADQLFISIPADRDAPNLITELEAIALKYKILIPSIEISDSSVAPSVASSKSGASTANSVQVNFAIISSFENLNSFIQNIENDIRFMNVKTMSMTVSEQDPKEITMTMQLDAFKRESDPVKSVGTNSSSVSTSSSTGVNNE